MNRKIEVVITDGNTTVNELHRGDETIADVLKQHGFNWLHGTLKVNGAAILEESEKDFISCPISDFAPSFKQNAKIKIGCKTPDNDPSKLTAKQIAKLHEKQKAVESADSPSPVKGIDTRFCINTQTDVYYIKDGVAIP